MIEEHPILMSGPMVRAILEGRKTQTRRMVKLPKSKGLEYRFEGARVDGGDNSPFSCGQYFHMPFRSLSDGRDGWKQGTSARIFCPYGAPGDRLWVKETHARIHEGILAHLDPEPDNGEQFNNGWSTVYRADGEPANWKQYGIHWKPSIFMRRQYSRLTLEIQDVRVQRLQDISEEDAKAEGFIQMKVGGTPQEAIGHTSYHDGYRYLWECLNGKGSWAKNPWVWVIEFKTFSPMQEFDGMIERDLNHVVQTLIPNKSVP
jgi:hypothetical protein